MFEPAATIAAIVAIIATAAAIRATLLRNKDRQQLQDTRAALESSEQRQQAAESELKGLREDHTRAREDNARLQAEKRNAEQNLLQHKQDVESMKNAFTAISQDIMTKNTTQANKGIKEMLEPLKDRINNFETHMRQSFSSQSQQQTTLKTQIENIIKTSNTLRDQTENLSNALQADIRVQGQWGEVMLERVVQAAGLREGKEYSTQGKGMDLKYPHGSSMKPDLIIHLPDDRNLVIDAKVSLTSYERYVNAESEQQKQQELKAFFTSVRNHVDGLAQRQYHSAEGMNSPDFTILFTPIDGAFILLQEDSELQQRAWQSHIAIVSPSTLWPILMTVQSLWRIEHQNQNAQKIAEEAGKIHDKIAGFAEDMDKLGKQINTVNNTYDAAMNKLSSGRGNILGKTEKLRELGASASKKLPRFNDQ